MKKVIVMLIGGVGAILLGLPYIFHAFGPTEAEVVTWGKVSLYTGLILTLLAIVIGRSPKKLFRGILALGYLFLALLQVLPIFLWFTFHGMGISDGTPPSPFVAHWGYAIPHLAEQVVSLGVIVFATRR
ncbi:MAG: hypothetical protein JXR84_03470 [Anaerolineae bacterium]|nr:hypothetical protein [Anaerolineae bacterium]